MAVTQDDVVRAAVELLDESGLAGLTLRGVAARLGVSAPTLYWHVRDKRHLLDLVADRVIAADDQAPGSAEPAHGQPVWEWLGQRSRAQRAALLAHRDSAQVVAGNRPTEAALPTIERMLVVLVAAGLQPGEAVRILTAVGSYILGDALETQSNIARPPPRTTAAGWDEHYPTVAAAGRTMGDDDDRFEEGLCLILDGLQMRLQVRCRSAAPAAGRGAQPGPRER